MLAEKFHAFLESLNSLTPQQVEILRQSLPEPTSQDVVIPHSHVMQAVVERFDESPVCPHCKRDDIGRWGEQSGYPRYRCRSCLKTFNAMTGTSLSHLRIRHKVDGYIECMRGDTTLRTAASQCDISLPASFLMRHRLMAVIAPDKAELLSGVSELDETFFRESFKGQRELDRPARKRGGRKARKKSKAEDPIKKIPVMVACDRQNHVTDAVLEQISADELETHLRCRVQPGSILCADAFLSHETVAERLELQLKELVTTAGIHVLEGIYHIQHVNAYHSDLKSWIYGFFKGIATKNLSKYLGWKRFLKTEKFSTEGFIERISDHWAPQLLC